MMRRVWAAALTALAVVGVFLVLAVSQRRAPTQQIVVTRTASGALVPLAGVPAGSLHGTTQSSGVAGGSLSASGPVPAVSAAIPTTRSS